FSVFDMINVAVFFFFSSRRRHTRSKRDWSSDVCSSDLSYQFIALDSTLSMGDNYATFIIDAFNQMFLIAFQMSIPLVGCLFLVDVALGLIARTVPQLNVFVVGLP